MKKPLALLLLLSIISLSCNRGGGKGKEEQIEIEPETELETTSDADTALYTTSGISALQQIPSIPQSVILTGHTTHRLLTIYKQKSDGRPAGGISLSRSYYEEDSDGGKYTHFMPGLDLIYGYNMLNIAHMDLNTNQSNFLFKKPVLIKSLYYPSFEQDSIDKKPVTRNYYLVSAYDQDTNNDTLINKKDLRRIYHFDLSGTRKQLLVPDNYSVTRSQYDSENDLMYIYAQLDTNKNGSGDKPEPTHLFYLNLKNPAPAIRLY